MKSIIAGVDEVGRGSLIGPVFAAAVIFKKKVDKKKFKASNETKFDLIIVLQLHFDVLQLV